MSEEESHIESKDEENQEESSPSIKRFLTRRKFIYTSIAAAFTDAFLIEPNLSSITYENVRVPYLPPGLNNLKVVQLTDFHYSPSSNYSLMAGIVEKVNALNPDLIMLTGDYVDEDNPNIEPLLEHFAKLKSKYGIIGCMGNHDGWLKPGSHYKNKLEALGIHFLINENTQLNIKGDILNIAATDFVWLGNPDPLATLKGIAKDSPLITLVHEPDYFDTMLNHRDHHLQLSGHTHGGQCRVPLIHYAPRKVKYGRKYIHGSYSKQDSTVFVSKGIGTVDIPVRFSCLPEIAVLNLVG